MTKEEHMEYRRAIVHKAQNKRRALAISKGLCSICAKMPVEDGYRTCEACRKRIGEANRRRREHDR